MSVYWIGQIIGIIAFFVGVTIFLHRTDNGFRGQLAIYSTMIGIHFFCMGANVAGVSALLNTTRTVISMRTRNTVVMVAFILLTLFFGIYHFKHPMEILPMFGTIISTWALFRTRGLTTRYILWFATACWTIYNAWLGSIGGSLTEGCFLIVNALTIIRFRRMQKQGIDPFAVTVK